MRSNMEHGRLPTLLGLKVRADGHQTRQFHSRRPFCCAVEIKERAVLDGAVDACQAAATRFSDSPSVA